MKNKIKSLLGDDSYKLIYDVMQYGVQYIEDDLTVLSVPVLDKKGKNTGCWHNHFRKELHKLNTLIALVRRFWPKFVPI